jgi:hypothetical protein
VKNIVLISLLFLANHTFASHLLGGEITYEHITNTQYQINVKLYRDCDDCKLGGQGGGSSTSNCADLTEIYIASYGACGNANLGSIPLQKTGFEDITSVCSQSQSKCSPNSNYAYGIEAHYYKGFIDFDDFKSYENCTFQLFLHKSERSSSVTTLYTENEDLFTYAIINPWLIDHNSPSFSEQAQILFNLNQPVYLNDGVISSTKDSLSFNWGSPLGSKNNVLGYQQGYAPNKFITPFCPSGDCTPNASAAIPTGISLNQQNGDIVFTPTGSNEVSTRVLEVEQWRKINGNWQRLGLIRRDVIIKVINANYNQPPVITSEEITVCEGQSLNAEIFVSDKQSVINGETQPSDTVRLNAISNLPGLQIQEVAIGSAPYFKLKISLDSTSGISGTYRVQVTATDNQCPKPATTTKTIILKIIPKPTLNYKLTKAFCGTTLIDIDTANLTRATATFVNSANTAATLNLLTKNNSYQSLLEENISLILHAESTEGCEVTDSISYLNSGNKEQKASIHGATTLCDNELLNLNLNHELNIQAIRWVYNGSFITEDTLKKTATNNHAVVQYYLEKDGHTCPLQDTVKITAHASPKINLPPIAPTCIAENIDLNNYNPSPSGGIWNAEIPIVNGIISKSSLQNVDQTINVVYTFTNENNCSDSSTLELTLKQAPELELIDEVICGDKFEYRLSNTIRKPYDRTNKAITWTLLTKPGAKIGSGLDAKLDLPNFGTGNYIILGQHILSNGCSVTDSVTISVEDALELKTNGNFTVCQQGEPVNLETHLNINAKGGGWYSNDAGALLNEHYFTPTACGSYRFGYTYDKYGCYDQIDLELRVVCKPDFVKTLPQQACENAEPIELPRQHTWFGNGISNNQFIAEEAKPINFLRARTIEDGCIYDSIYTIQVVEKNFISWSELPTQLCEDEKLSVLLQHPKHSSIDIKACNNFTTSVRHSLDYTPQSCDLDAGSIQLQIGTQTEAFCPTIDTLIEIAYYQKPVLNIPNTVTDCAPFRWSTQFANPHTSYTLASQHSSISGIGQKHTIIQQHGEYHLSLKETNNFGCSDSAVIPNYMQLNSTPHALFSIDENRRTFSLSDRAVGLTNQTINEDGEDLNFEWSLLNTKSNYFLGNTRNPYIEFPADTGLFDLTLTAAATNGCADTASLPVEIVPDIRVFIPNAFTPDLKGPEENATFSIICDNVASFHIRIYNKWGQKVFESFDIEDSWDGTNKGEFCQNGVYLYNLDIINKAGKNYVYQGTVNLIR